VKGIIESVPGVVDAFNGIVISGPSFIVHVDSLKARMAGLSVADLREILGDVMRGDAATNVQKGEKLIPVRVRYPAQYRTDLDRLEGMMIAAPEGAFVPLRTIATFERTPGQEEIDRDGLRRMVAVTARLSGRSLGDVMAEIQDRLNRRLVLPPGVRMEFGGIYQTQQESFRGLLLVSCAAVLLVFIVLLFEFGEFAVPLSIVCINLFSLFGVVAALWLAGVSFNISSFVGVIMIIGIVAENAIFVFHRYQELLREGREPDAALVRAVLDRKRPILMTTAAAVLALLPLALGLGAGSQMQQPLAIAVIGGFSLSSILLFFGLPLVYRLFRRAATA